MDPFEEFIQDMHKLDLEAMRKKFGQKNDEELLSELKAMLVNLEERWGVIRKNKWRLPLVFVQGLILSWKIKYRLRRVVRRRTQATYLSDREIQKMKKDIFWQKRYERYLAFIQSEDGQKIHNEESGV